MKSLQDKIFFLIRFVTAIGCIYLIFREGLLPLLSRRYAVLLFTASIIGVFLLTMVISVFRVTRILFAAALLFLTLFYFPMETLPKLLGVSAILLGLNELAGERKKEKGAVLILLAALTLLCPTKREPFDWSFVLRWAEAMQEGAETAFNELSYLFEEWFPGKGEETGYSSFFAEAGELSANDRTELSIRGETNGASLYLSGKSYRDFDGRVWTNRETDAETEGAWFPRYINLLYQNRVLKEKARMFSRLHKTDITYELLRTRDVIHPETTISVSAGKEAVLPGYSFPEIKGKGTAYTVLWLEIDYGSVYFDELIGTAGQYPLFADYRTLAAYTEELYGKEAASAFTRELYDEAIKASAPERGDITYTEQTAAYAKKLTKGFKSDYEKLRAIEEALRQYSYTLSPQTGKKDLVETFLFRTKEGYCIHFASAAAELMDLSGIPSRIVMGYDTVTGKEKENGRLPVLGSEAHAWAEGYIEGFGWVPVEATPIKPAPVMSGWGLLLPEDQEKEETEERAEEVPNDPAPGIGTEAEEEPDPAGQNARRILLLLLLLIPALFFGRLLLRELLFLLLPEQKKLRLAIRSLRQLLETRFHTKNEPLLSFTERLKEEDREEFRETVLSYYRYSYGGETPEEGLFQRIRALRKKLRKSSAIKPQGTHFAAWLRVFARKKHL